MTYQVLEYRLMLQNSIYVAKSMINSQNLNEGHKVQSQVIKSNLCYIVHIDIAKNPIHVMKLGYKIQFLLQIQNDIPNREFELQVKKIQFMLKNPN